MSWRSIQCKQGTAHISAELGEFGPTNWSISLSDGTETVVVSPQPDDYMSEIANRIRGIEDYWNIKKVQRSGQSLPRKEQLARLWIDIVTSALKNDVSISGDVALIPSDARIVKSYKVIPKSWQSPIMEEDDLVVQLSNFWVGTYSGGTYPGNPVFRLSSYDTSKYGKVDAKEATVYIDLHPEEDCQEILELLGQAEVIYLPDLRTVSNLRTLPCVKESHSIDEHHGE